MSMKKLFFFSKQKSTLIENPHLGSQSLQLPRQSTYYRNQVASLSVKLKYLMNMIFKIFPKQFFMACSQRSCFFCMLPNYNH